MTNTESEALDLEMSQPISLPQRDRVQHARWRQRLLMELGHTGRERAMSIALEGRAILGRALAFVRR